MASNEVRLRDRDEFGHSTSTPAVVEACDGYLDALNLWRRFWTGCLRDLTPSHVRKTWKVVDDLHSQDLGAAAELRGIDPTPLYRFATNPRKAYLDEAESVVRRLFTFVAMELESESETGATAGPSGGAQNFGASDDGDYQPGAWFGKSITARLRQAAQPGRKTKRVRSRMIDGVKCYHVGDARRWWPDDVPKA